MRDRDRDRDFGRELSEEAKGLGQQVKGKIKEETGDLLNDRSMENEGRIEKNLGKVRRDISSPTDTVRRDWDEDTDSEGRNVNRDRISERDRSSGSSSDLERDRDRSRDKGRSDY